MKNNSKKRKSFSEIFKNEKFLILFSVFVSFVIWVIVAASSGDTVDYKVSDIPVTMDLSDDASEDGLTVVSIDGTPIDEFTASVKVTGNSVTVGSLTSSDIEVYGSNLGSIVTSGTYNVELSAKSSGVKSNYNIVSVSPSEVTIVVDRNIEKEFELESQITASAPSGYYMGSPTFSTKSVVVKGPEQSLSKVSNAVVKFDINEELTETITLSNLDILLLDSDGNEVADDSLVVEPITVDATIPVLIKKTVPIVLNCENQPNGLDLDSFITIDPVEIEIAASGDIIDSIESISIGTLDFDTLRYGVSYMDFEVVMPEGVRNLNTIDTARVYFDFSEMSSMRMTISDFEFINTPSGIAAQYSSYSSININIVGLKTELESLSESSISAVIDLTDATLGTVDMNVDVNIAGITSCWVYGSYSINVTVSYEMFDDSDSDSLSSYASSVTDASNSASE